MPYATRGRGEGFERSLKASHVDIVKNPEVQAFLDDCEYLREPSPEEAQRLVERFEPVPHTSDAPLPAQVIAVDGSRYEASRDDRVPSTRVGFVKVSTVLVSLEEFAGLRPEGRFVDPHRVARLKKGNEALSFVLPSANVVRKGLGSVRDSFRAAVDAQLLGEPTRFDAADYRTSLRSTLFEIAARRKRLGTGDPSAMLLHRCPSCGKGPVRVEDVEDEQFCEYCGALVYPADVLRLWEAVGEFTPNVEAITRFMNLAERLMPLHFIRHFAATDDGLDSLAGTAFFVDGPLAIFGNTAPLHAGVMRFLAGVNERLAARGRDRLLLIGLQKSGQLADHAGLVSRYVPGGRLLAVDDDYRYEHVVCRDKAKNGFGAEDYFGQDFVFKTASGRTFVFALPYPFASKDEALDFHDLKADPALYEELPRALRLIEHFEYDLYKDAVVPVALAHRYTAISLRPGGRVLDLLAKRALS